MDDKKILIEKKNFFIEIYEDSIDPLKTLCIIC